jgi:hypothetical protein
MLGDLFVVFKAQISKFVNNVKQMLGITQGAAQKINASAKEMEGALTSAFSGELRNNISNLSENISLTREKIVNLKDELKFLISEQKNLKQGTDAFKETAKAIDDVKAELFEAQQELTEFNIAARDQKKALADSRLAAEDNSAAIEATGRAINAASSIVLLLGDNFEGLKPVLKGVSIAMAVLNSAVVIQNLKLRENAVLTNLATRAQGALKAAFIGTSAAGTAVKTVLSSLGIGLAIVAVSTLVSKMIEMSSATSKAEESQKKFNESIANFGGKEITKVNLLVAQVNDLSLSLDTRRKALSDLQSIFPAYFKNLDDEKILSGQVRIETGRLTNAILANAKARALRQRIEENETEKLKIAQESATAVAKLAKETKSFEEQAASGADGAGFYQTRITRLREEISKASERLGELTAESRKYSEEISKISQQTDPFIGTGAADAGKSSASSKTSKQTTKDLKQAVNEQQKLAILEAQLNGERLLLLQTTEEGRASVINATQDEILAIRKAFFLQSATAQGLDQNESLAAWKQYQLDLVSAETDKNNRLSKARDKDTDDAESNALYLAMLNEESLDGMIEMQDEKYAILSGALAKEYNDGLVTLEQYNQNKLNAEIAYLENLIKIKKAYGVFAIEEEKKLASMSLKITKDTTDERDRLLQDANRQIAQAYQSLFADLAVTLGNSLAALATNQNPVQTFLNGVLNSVASFMDSFGKSIIAVGIATTKFNFALTTLQGPAAIAAGIALVAAAGVARNLAKTGPTAFAQGGIVSGPTLGLVGEYPGASTNPEVIAPLDKLKSLIGGNGEGSGFIAETRISGRDLSIVLNRYNKDNARG